MDVFFLEYSEASVSRRGNQLEVEPGWRVWSWTTRSATLRTLAQERMAARGILATHSPLLMGPVATTPTSSQVPSRVIHNWNITEHISMVTHLHGNTSPRQKNISIVTTVQSLNHVGVVILTFKFPKVSDSTKVVFNHGSYQFKQGKREDTSHEMSAT